MSDGKCRQLHKFDIFLFIVVKPEYHLSFFIYSVLRAFLCCGLLTLFRLILGFSSPIVRDELCEYVFLWLDSFMSWANRAFIQSILRLAPFQRVGQYGERRILYRHLGCCLEAVVNVWRKVANSQRVAP